jgi:hypothetical protein
MPEDRGLFLLAVADLRLLLFIILMHQLVYFMTGLENSNSFTSFHYFSFIMFYSKAESWYFGVQKAIKGLLKLESFFLNLDDFHSWVYFHFSIMNFYEEVLFLHHFFLSVT